MYGHQYSSANKSFLQPLFVIWPKFTPAGNGGPGAKQNQTFCTVLMKLVDAFSKIRIFVRFRDN